MAAAATAEREVTIEGGVRGTWSDAGAGAPCIVCLHGFGGNRNEVDGHFTGIAARLAAGGLAALRIDFPGCGASPGDFGDVTIKLYSAAARAALRHARARTEGPLGLLGFSFGGAVATTCLADPALPIRALALWAPVGRPEIDMVKSLGAARAEEAARTGFVDVPWSEGSIRLKHGFFAGLADARPAEALAAYEGDVFIAAGSRDRLAKYVPLLHDAAARARTRRSLMLDGADHFFRDIGGGRASADALLDATASFFAASLARGRG